MRILLLVGLVGSLTAAGCSRRARVDEHRPASEARPAPRRAAGPKVQDAGLPWRPPPAGAATPAHVIENLSAIRVVKQSWFECHVYSRYVVLLNRSAQGHQVAVKAAGPNVAASCRWKGPFLHLVGPRWQRHPHPSFAPGIRVAFRGVFRDLLLFDVLEDCGGTLVIHDLAAGKERLRVGYTAESGFTYAGNGRFTLWQSLLSGDEKEKLEPAFLAPKRDEDRAFRDAKERQCTEALWRQLAVIKIRHRPLFDAVKEKPCYDKWNYSVSKDEDEPDAGLRYTPGKIHECSKYGWEAKHLLDLRDLKVRLLPEIRCTRSSLEEC